MNSKRSDPQVREAKLREGKEHLRFVLSLYSLQIKNGRFFLHEHPAGAASWREPMMENFLARRDVGVVRGDMCMYGLYTKTKDGRWLRSMKPTKWASNSPMMLERLSRKCSGDHAHQHLEGRERTSRAAICFP